MEQFRPELETCPICNAKGTCHIHAYYGRNIIDFQDGMQIHDNLCIQRVFCDSCDHSHAILPDFIIPYSCYGLFFILRVLAEFFSHLHTVETICERYNISMKQFYKWLSLWKSHKQEWLGVLIDSETDHLSFLKRISCQMQYSLFSQEFCKNTSFSFLQSHRNPLLKHPKNARYHQQVFKPDYLLW